MLVPEDYNDVHRAVLRALAVQVIATLDPQHSMEQLIKNPVTLHSYVSKMRVNWPGIARDLGMTRASVYHWYNETHLRRISGVKMSPDDKKIIKDAIIRGIETKEILGNGFQMSIRNLFESKYPRQEIMMTYNNMLRSRDVQRILNKKKLTLPTKRHTDVFVSKMKSGLGLSEQRPTLSALAVDGGESNSPLGSSSSTPTSTSTSTSASTSTSLSSGPSQSSQLSQPAAFPLTFSSLPQATATTPVFAWQTQAMQQSVSLPTGFNLNTGVPINGGAIGNGAGNCPITAATVSGPQGPVIMCLLPTSANSPALFSLPLQRPAFVPQPPVFSSLDQDIPLMYKT